MKLTKEARSWYRSAMVWFIGLAGVMQALKMALPEVQNVIPNDWYDAIMGVCVFIGAVARFIQQPRMQESVEEKEANHAE